MTWSYGVVVTKHDEEEWYAVHELFHDEGDKVSWTAEPVTFEADSMDDLEAMLDMALKDVRQAKVDDTLVVHVKADK